MTKRKLITGWIAVGISLLISLIWAYWGAIENFHEGWYSPSLFENLLIFFIQYIPITLLFILLPLVAMRWKKIGLALFIALAIFSVFFFSGASFEVVYLMIAFPLILLGFLFFFGDPQPRRWAVRLIIFPPLILILVITIPNIIRVQSRLNDGDFSARKVDCQGDPLVWAARGPGFPESGATWQEAYDSCRYLSDDGNILMEDVQDIWRLPSIEESVRCQTRHDENAGGIWDAENEAAQYEQTPDKETPLWDPHSQIIYYWTADRSQDKEFRAFIIDYKGGIFEKDIRYSPAYRSFRCVKNP